MLVLITYDVSTVEKKGQRRLRQVAKICEAYGVRVQNSVFECNVDLTVLTEMRIRLLDVVNLDEDSIRFYHLGDHFRNKIEHYGVKEEIKVDQPLIF